MSKQFPSGSDLDTETEAIESTELQAHTRGECPGYLRCLTCVMENEEKIAEQRELHPKGECDPILCRDCHREAEEEEQRHKEEETRRANARVTEILDVVRDQASFGRLFKI
jgi:hypothetical protein